MVSSDAFTLKNALTVLKDTTSGWKLGNMLTTAIFVGPSVWFLAGFGLSFGVYFGFNPLKNLKACLGLCSVKSNPVLAHSEFQDFTTYVCRSNGRLLDLQPGLYKLSTQTLALSIFACTREFRPSLKPRRPELRCISTSSTVVARWLVLAQLRISNNRSGQQCWKV